jgi:EmrB/QacA subfamily drug resistance transporter
MWLVASLTALTLFLVRRGRGGRGGGAVVPALLLAALAASMAQTIVISALPVFGRQLDVSAPAAAWLLTGFMLASAVAMPIAGRLGDLFGYRPILLVCLGCFTFGTLVAAIGTELSSFPVLLAGRGLQGLSGGVFPLAFGIARSAVPAARLGGVIAVLSAMVGLGGAVGMVVAGPLVDLIGTASLFWMTLILAAAALAMGVLLPGSVRRAAGGRLDVGGAVLLSAGLVGVLLTISQGGSWGWGSARLIGLGMASAAALVGFAVVQVRVANPLVGLHLLRRRAVATTNLATLVIGVAMFGAVTLIPQFVQTPRTAGYGFGVSTTQAGLILVPVAICMLVATPLGARLGRRFGPRLALQLGGLGAAASFGALVFAHDQLWQFYGSGMLVGAGYGLAFAALGGLVVNAVDAHQTGIATAINTVVRTVGGALGAQIAATIVAADAPAGLPTESGYVRAFVVFGLLAVICIAVTFTIPAHPSMPARSVPASHLATVPAGQTASNEARTA